MKLFWDKRFQNHAYWNLHNTVDGTDCRTAEAMPFSSDWYSHTFLGPGLRYAAAVFIYCCYIVWKNGRLPVDCIPKEICNNSLENKLLHDEYVLAENRYCEPRVVHDINYELDTRLSTGVWNVSTFLVVYSDMTCLYILIAFELCLIW